MIILHGIDADFLASLISSANLSHKRHLMALKRKKLTKNVTLLAQKKALHNFQFQGLSSTPPVGASPWERPGLAR
jgi:hypothetical protein